jgi:hypothetical protein
MSIAQRATGLDFCIVAGERWMRKRHFSIYLEFGGYDSEAKLHLIRIERPGASYPPPGFLSISNLIPCLMLRLHLIDAAVSSTVRLCPIDNLKRSLLHTHLVRMHEGTVPQYRVVHQFDHTWLASCRGGQ